MESKNLLTLAITLTVGIILAGSLLMPVISDATTTEKSFQNNGYYNLTYSEADDLTLTWDYTKPNVVTVNDTDITLSIGTFPGPVNIACGDDWFLRWTGTDVQFFSTNNASVTAAVANSTSISLTASNGSATITNTAPTPVSQTVSYTFMYVVDPAGLYVMKNSADAAYLKGDSEIYAIGRSSTTGIVIKLKITGNIKDGFTAEEVGSSGANATVGTPVATYTEVEGYKDLYSLTKIEVPIDFEITGTPASFTPTYTYFIVPASVTAELSQHLAPGEIAILNALPVLIIAALVVMAAGAIFLKRDD